MKSISKFLSILLSVFLAVAHLNAITTQAASLQGKDSSIIYNAIQNTEQSKHRVKKDYIETLASGETKLVRSFTITNLDKPKNGELLDGTATVVTDSGFTWDIPVIWVDKEGNVIHLAIEIDNIVRSYPVLVFYVPDGFTLVSGEDAASDIQMPDFVIDLIKDNGATTLSMPESGLTYISALLPETDNFKVNVEGPKDDEDSVQSADSSSRDKQEGGSSEADSDPVKPDPINPDPVKPDQVNPDPVKPDPVNPDPVKPDPINPEPEKPIITSPTDNEKTPPEVLTSDEDKQKLVEAHCDGNVISKIGVEKLAALVNWVKNTLEPEAANLLVNKFPAFKNAAKSNELGKELGLYVFYNDYYGDDGTVTDRSKTLASIDSVSDSDGDLQYRLIVNAGGFYRQDEDTGEYVFDGDTAYTDLDNTLVHEMMHALMFDYNRTGMTGWQYDKKEDDYNLDSKDDLLFPEWFTEGTASTVENMFQYWNDEYYEYFNNDKRSLFSEKTLKSSYKNNPEFNLDGGGEGSNYLTGYLACLYLSYLSAKADDKDAITGSLKSKDLRVDSAVIRQGLSNILEDLHEGKTLDDIIAKISEVDGKSLYKDTKDFESKFIVNSSSDDKSLEFCTDLLNYLHKSSSGDNIANGSILIDFSDTNDALLSKSYLKNKQNVYVPTDDKNYVSSTVDSKKTRKGAGKSETGVSSSSSSNTIARLNKDTEENLLVAKVNKNSVLDNGEDQVLEAEVGTEPTGKEKKSALANKSELGNETEPIAKDDEIKLIQDTSEKKSAKADLERTKDTNEALVEPVTGYVKENADKDSKQDSDKQQQEGIEDESIDSIVKLTDEKELINDDKDEVDPESVEKTDLSLEQESSSDGSDAVESEEELIERTEEPEKAVESGNEESDVSDENTVNETASVTDESENANDQEVVETEEAPVEDTTSDEATIQSEISTDENTSVANTSVDIEPGERQEELSSSVETEASAEASDETEPDAESSEQPYFEPQAEENVDSSNEESVSEQAQEDTLEVTVTEEASEEHIDNPIIISESEEEPEEDNNDDGGQEQVLDAIPEDDSGEDDGAAEEEVSD